MNLQYFVTFLCDSGLVQKAKKAKDKLLKRDGEDRPDTGSYESFYYGGVDPYMWEPQELGKKVLISEQHMYFSCFLFVGIVFVYSNRSNKKSPGYL